MSKHKTFFGKIFGWIGDLFHNANKDLLQAAIDITNTIKAALNSGIVDFITGLIPGTLDDSIVAALRTQLPVLLADELLVQSVGTPATEADAQLLATKLVDSFGLMTDAKKEKLYTSIAADIYIFLQNHLHGEKVTFGEAASLAESMYQAWLAEQNTPTS